MTCKKWTRIHVTPETSLEVWFCCRSWRQPDLSISSVSHDTVSDRSVFFNTTGSYMAWKYRRQYCRRRYTLYIQSSTHVLTVKCNLCNWQILFRFFLNENNRQDEFWLVLIVSKNSWQPIFVFPGRRWRLEVSEGPVLSGLVQQHGSHDTWPRPHPAKHCDETVTWLMWGPATSPDWFFSMYTP